MANRRGPPDAFLVRSARRTGCEVVWWAIYVVGLYITGDITVYSVHAGTHREVRVVCMPSEGTPHAHAAGTFSGHRQRSRRHRRPEVWLTEG